MGETKPNEGVGQNDRDQEGAGEETKLDGAEAIRLEPKQSQKTVDHPEAGQIILPGGAMRIRDWGATHGLDGLSVMKLYHDRRKS